MYLDLVGAASKNVHYMGEVNPEGFTNPRTSEKKREVVSPFLVQPWLVGESAAARRPMDLLTAPHFA